MAEQFENNYSTLLNGAINNSVTTLTVDAVPVEMTGDFRIKIGNELILVGAVSGLTFTGCTRGVEGTTAASHSDNAPVTHVLTAEGLLKSGIYPTPSLLGHHGNYTSGSASCAVTTTAYSVDVPLIALVYSTGRGANSITHSNVTWTQRYTGNGNSQYFQVWTGVVAGGSSGTTATVAFTGNNIQYVDIISLDNYGPFTTASSIITATAASTAAASLFTRQGLTQSNYYVWGVSANSPSTSSQASPYPYVPTTITGGQGRGGLFRAVSKGFLIISTSSSAVNYFGAIVELS